MITLEEHQEPRRKHEDIHRHSAKDPVNRATPKDGCMGHEDSKGGRSAEKIEKGDLVCFVLHAFSLADNEPAE